MDFDRFFYDTLLNYVNEENDLTTAVFMFLVANLHGKFDKSKIDSIYLDEWMANYIELLAKFELWNKRIEILKAYQSDFVNSLAQKSITYTSMCSSCKKTIPANSYLCIECRRNVFLCVYWYIPFIFISQTVVYFFYIFFKSFASKTSIRLVLHMLPRWPHESHCQMVRE